MTESAVFDTYRKLWAARYGVPCALILSPLDFGKLGTHIREHGLTVAQLEEALTGYFETDNPLVLRRKHPLGLFLVNPMQYATVPKPKYAYPCPHEKRCESTWACCHQQDRERV